MKNLLPRTLWDYLVGALVGVVVAALAALLVGVVATASEGGVSRVGTRLTPLWPTTLVDNLPLLATVIFLGVLLVVTLYELTRLYRARGRMKLGGGTEARLLTRDALLRALVAGGLAGLYTALVVLVFALLAEGAFGLELGWVFSLGLLPPVMLIAAGALAYTFAGTSLSKGRDELYSWEQIVLLTLPLALSALLGLIFGAAAPGAAGVLNAALGALLTYGLIERLSKLRWRVLRRAAKGVIDGQDGPTIKLVSEHRA